MEYPIRGKDARLSVINGHVPLSDRLKSLAATLIGTLVPKRPGKVVIYSQPDFEDGAIAVLEGLRERGIEPIVLCNDTERARAMAALVGSTARLVRKRSIRGGYHFLTAKTVIMTHSPFRSHRPPRTQTVLNIWHGEPLTKPVGLWDGNAATPSTWATTLSEVGKAFRCAEFGMLPRQVRVTGAPRNDRLQSADRDAVRRAAFPAPGAHLFLWLPTYRDATSTGRVDGEAFEGPVPLAPSDVRALGAWLEARDAWLLVKAHQLQVSPDEASARRIVLVDEQWIAERGLTLYTLLKGVDCLITDASTVWIDFLLAGRPLICAFPDIDLYRERRGLHLEPYEEWMPAPIVKTGAELIAALSAVAAGEDPHAGERGWTLKRLHRHVDAGSTDRALELAGL